jgi:hypothetical protein
VPILAAERLSLPLLVEAEAVVVAGLEGDALLLGLGAELLLGASELADDEAHGGVGAAQVAEAEELAAIADDLLFPGALRQKLARLKAGKDPVTPVPRT